MAADWLDEATHKLRGDSEPEAEALSSATTPDDYRRFPGRAYGLIAPVERSLLDTTDLYRYLDLRRLRKHLLIEHDLRTLGVALVESQGLPECIPMFEDPLVALGWASAGHR